MMQHNTYSIHRLINSTFLSDEETNVDKFTVMELRGRGNQTDHRYSH